MPSVPMNGGISQNQTVVLDYENRSRKSGVLSVIAERAKLIPQASLLQFRYKQRPANVCS